MDIKDAYHVFHEDDVTECEDAMPAVAADLVRRFLDCQADDLQGRLGERDLLQFCQLDLGDHRLFRYSGVRFGPALEHAFADVLWRYAFPPKHVWLDGRFTCMTDVEEVRAGGKVVYPAARAPSAGRVRGQASPGMGEPFKAALAKVGRDVQRQRTAAALSEAQRHRLEALVKEMFNRSELHALLSGDVVSLHNSAEGGAFAQSTAGQRSRVDATEGLTNHVLQRLVEVLHALDGQGPILDADIQVVASICACLPFCRRSAAVPPGPSQGAPTSRKKVAGLSCSMCGFDEAGEPVERRDEAGRVHRCALRGIGERGAAERA